MSLNLDFTGMTEEEIESYCDTHSDEICAYAHSLDPDYATPMTAAEQGLWRCALAASVDRQHVCELVAEARRTGSSPERIAKLLRICVDEMQTLLSSAHR